MLTCVVIDDEPIAREILRDYISKTPGLLLQKEFNNAVDAVSYFNENTTDLIFLDIRMPHLSGLDFIKVLENPPQIIITTAYPEHAVEGFDLEVLDYLLKPIGFERFLKAVNKLRRKREQEHQMQGFMTIKSDKRLYRLPYDEILYFRSMSDYVKVFTEKQQLIFHHSMKQLENELPSSFCRIHKSYIASLPKIDYIEGNQVCINNTYLPVGESYKEKLFASL